MSQSNEADYPHSTRRDPGGIRAEHGFLLLFAIALTAAGAFCAVDEYTAIDFTRGIYSILTGLFVVGGAGWLSRSAARQTQGEVKRLREEVASLRQELLARQESQQWAPPWGRAQLRAVGGTYASQTAMDVTTQPLSHRPGLDAETIADAREIARKMLGRDKG